MRTLQPFARNWVLHLFSGSNALATANFFGLATTNWLEEEIENNKNKLIVLTHYLLVRRRNRK
jgi:hypothetical protein